ncbi:hypothetical protein MPSEU_000762400 [Mayamaea pseudoterrestris]|nr:hypothetical protein MPSEU_000762400 [Mayamaea pseudoterrestris]
MSTSDMAVTVAFEPPPTKSLTAGSSMRRKAILLAIVSAATLWFQLPLPQLMTRELFVIKLPDVRLDVSVYSKQEKDASTPSGFVAIDKNVSRSVFYNVFIPDTDDGKNNTLRIVEEQLQQVAQSYAVTSMEQPMPVFYHTVGAANVLTKESMASLCPAPLECHHVQHHSQGFEAVTLNSLRDYCIERPNVTVSYIHSKGSYHNIPLNERWRRILTDAALSEQCYSHMGTDCNVCGAQFYAIWSYFFPGNMWTANCDYVMQLTTPDFFGATMLQVRKRFLLLRLRKHMTTEQMTFEQITAFALERYADEIWVGSHPDIRPCDCLRTRQLAALVQPDLTRSDLEFFKGLRDYQPAVRPAVEETMNETEARMRDFFVFSGMLMKWYTLHGRAPDPSSWVWTHNPDGAFWLDKVEQFGEKAIEEVMGLPLAAPILFAPTNSSSVFADVGKRRETTFVFFDAHIPSTISSRNFVREMESINQLVVHVKGLAESLDRKVIMLYNTIDDEVLTQDLSHCAATNSDFQCLPLSQNTSQYEGETLRQLFMFCQENPSQSVSYIHNRVPKDLAKSSIDVKRRFSRHMAMAVMSSQCAESLTEQCNVCGLKLETMPHPELYENMFSAKCDYVNKLLPPNIYVERMESHIADVLHQMLAKRFNAGIQKASPKNLGLGEHSLSYWIGSHPDLMPCDLTDQSLKYWTMENRTSNDFSAASMRRQIPHSWKYDALAVANVTADPSLSLREIQYLPGQVFRWHNLYHKMPDSSSPIYQLYPSGQVWSECMERNSGGLDCFNEIL